MSQQPMLLLTGLDQEPKWLNSPVRFHKGSLADIPQHIPDFDRQDFALGIEPSNQASPMLTSI